MVSYFIYKIFVFLIQLAQDVMQKREAKRAARLEAAAAAKQSAQAAPVITLEDEDEENVGFRWYILFYFVEKKNVEDSYWKE